MISLQVWTTRTWPPFRPRARSASRAMASAWCRMVRAWLTMRSPTGVNLAPCRPRKTSITPRCSSRAEMLWLTADCDMSRYRAASLKVSCSATATKIRSQLFTGRRLGIDSHIVSTFLLGYDRVVLSSQPLRPKDHDNFAMGSIGPGRGSWGDRPNGATHDGLNLAGVRTG